MRWVWTLQAPSSACVQWHSCATTSTTKRLSGHQCSSSVPTHSNLALISLNPSPLAGGRCRPSEYRPEIDCRSQGILRTFNSSFGRMPQPSRFSKAGPLKKVSGGKAKGPTAALGQPETKDWRLVVSSPVLSNSPRRGYPGH